MNTHRRPTATILVTLAELAWLLLFGVLLAYNDRVSEGKKLIVSQKQLQKLIEEQRQTINTYENKDRQLSADYAVLMGRSVEVVEKLKAENTKLTVDLAANQKKLLDSELGKQQLEKVIKSNAVYIVSLEQRLDQQAKDLSRLEDQLKSASAQLAAESTARQKVAQELKSTAAQLEAERSAKQKLELQLKQVEQRLAAASKAAHDLEMQAQELRRRVVALDSTIAKLQERLKPFSDRFGQIPTDQLAKYLASLETDAAKWRATATNQTATGGAGEAIEFSIRRELIGLPTTKLNRVIFIVDTSTSMKGPWESQARPIVLAWLEHLPIEECVMVTYDDTARAFPTGGGYHKLRVGGKIDPAKQKQLLDYSKQLQFGGTYSRLDDALVKAYSRPKADKPDLIVLFTDGKADGKGDCMERARNEGVPVFVVALGNYHLNVAQKLLEIGDSPILFLSKLAKVTKGSLVTR